MPQLKCLPVLLLPLLVVACGSTPMIEHEVDRELTLEIARNEELKYCNIMANEVCQSADSLLVVHIPRELELEYKDRQVNSTVRLTNEGFDPITIDAYYIVLLDENNYAYEVNFEGPNNYGAARSFSPALVLDAKTEATIRFWEDIRLDARFIKAVKFFFRHPTDLDFNQIMVSYKPVNPYEAGQVYMEAQQP
ncbi:hypothetical protein GF356_09660 [candidate division GN15 bacterium]|nr:hypothetical protein [candidate division GN15 bacterium]